MAKPVLKWAGGKRQLLDELYARFPESFGRYHEPFFGGGAVFFDLEPAAATVNDTNPRLVNFYEQVRDRPEALIDRLRGFRDPEADPDPDLPFAEETRRGSEVEGYYYQQRARFNERAYGDGWPESDADRLEEAALLLYLNRTCYNGLYRENADGGFNVPIGRYADPDWVQADRVRAASRALAGTELRNGDFSYVLKAAEPGDLVYFDPPYEPMSPTADFAEYSAAGFDRDDQERLLDAAVELDERGAWVVLSNSGVTYDRYAEAGFSVEREGATRAINSDASSRGEVDEIVATNVPEGERRGPDQRALDDY
ncbi:DNA adenine methylase [Halosimplex marinum]|uniref:DNA adenine methylase n=1 Tax=Halosimplex marinum TaxID=3396620 RepID=UPI003F559276